jgi:type I restriction enzyme M protein
LKTSTAPFSNKTDWTLRQVYEEDQTLLEENFRAYRGGWKEGFAEEHVKIFRREDFAYHKVSVVFWQFDERDQPATISEPYETAFTAANLKKEQGFYDSDLVFRVRVKVGKTERTKTLTLGAKDNAAKKFKALMEDKPEVLAVEWTHRHYVKDDEYVPHDEDIEAFLDREIAKSIIRWQESPQLGYEILPNKYFYRYQSPTPTKNLLAEFWRLEKEAEKMLQGLAR